MIVCERAAADVASDGDEQVWTVTRDEEPPVLWRGLQTGPLTYLPDEVDALGRALLGIGPDELAAHAARVLVPAVGAASTRPALFLHSTTPELKTFEGDLDALARGARGGDFTTYKEARSVYLAKPGDVVVGRTRAWRAAVAALGAEAVVLDVSEYYYLSHALLRAASCYRGDESSPIGQVITHLRQTERVVKLYAFEREMQIALLWLARQAGLDALAVEANRPSVAAAWNRKSVLHPTVELARALEVSSAERASPEELLEREHQASGLCQTLGIGLPALPGYTVERAGRFRNDFVQQVQDAARLLRARYGLDLGCLKASESGDGARITPGIDLRDQTRLEALARDAWSYGDDYLLEAHVTYGRAEVAGHVLPTALSAHVRGGAVAPGATLQFVEGTSWKGNVLVDEHALGEFGVAPADYGRLRTFVADFLAVCNAEDPGLVLAGVDFAIGTVGGAFGETPLLGVQDLNVSFTGAECLRAFLDQAVRAKGEDAHRYGVTRIYRPTARGDHEAFLRVTRTFDRGPVFADTVASISGRWAMVGVTGTGPREALETLSELQTALTEEGLIEQVA